MQRCGLCPHSAASTCLLLPSNSCCSLEARAAAPWPRTSSPWEPSAPAEAEKAPGNAESRAGQPPPPPAPAPRRGAKPLPALAMSQPELPLLHLTGKAGAQMNRRRAEISLAEIPKVHPRGEGWDVPVPRLLGGARGWAAAL